MEYMWPFTRPKHSVFLTNTLSGTKELFIPQRSSFVSLYSCGPTVYGPPHIGNLRSYIFSDTLARVLAASGYRVKRVINITDVGHLVGDGDEGEDKMQVGAAREQATPEDIATRYTNIFLENLQTLNVDTKHIAFPRATDYIDEDIAMLKILEAKGATYTVDGTLYFDTSVFPAYGKLGNVAEASLKEGARVLATPGKKSLHDFALWRKAKPQDLQQWDAPWSKGNPGWHIECSVMSKALLGETLDIHTGGEDHIAVHHNNEIAQSETAHGKPFVRYWLHNAFLTIANEKISKSLGNTFTLADVTARGIHPLALRYLFLQAHYRSPLSFSWESLQAAHDALTRLWHITEGLKRPIKNVPLSDEIRNIAADDLATPQLIALLWKALGDTSLDDVQKWRIVEEIDQILGLSLTNPPQKEIITLADLPADVQAIAREREAARKAKDFARSDTLRIHIQERGYAVDDTPSGPLFTRTERE